MIRNIDRERGFANEYTCVLAGTDAGTDALEPVTAKDWAEYYLKKDNALTKQYVGFQIID